MDSSAEAERVVRDLTNTCRCDRSDIGLMARGSADVDGTQRGDADDGSRRSEMAHGAMKGAGTGAAVGGVLGLVAGVASLSIPGLGPFIAAGPIAATLAGAGVGAAAGGIIGALANLGVPEQDAHYYAEGVRRGGTLVTVHARSDAIADCAAEVMRQHGAADIDERAEHWKREGWKGRFDVGADTGAAADVLPVAQEELVVGKRQVSQSGIRVYTHVVERPVEETVHLREEHVDVQRRPVDRPIAAGDDAFRERTIEVRETVEEPVVRKQARVVEEVAVSKQATERDAIVRDTVRKTEVEVDRTDPTRAKTRYAGADRRRSGATAYTGPERRVAA
jgi:uncharacterized protein (TIGR02271 family)